MSVSQPKKLRARQRLGKYRIEKRLAEGGFASVYRGYDTLEAVQVAIKVPHQHLLTEKTLAELTREVRTSAKLDHPRILPVKNATIEDGVFLIAYPLGVGTLADRMRRRIAPRRALDYAAQALDALSYAHQKKVIHCDVKPENFIILPDGALKLHDFGIAKFARHTLRAESGSGTLGYVAPEQAFGKPSFRSDVFSMGLLLYRMLTGTLPEWPYRWPFEGHKRLREVANPVLVDFLKRSVAVDERKRFKDCEAMANAFKRLRPRALKCGSGSGRSAAKKSQPGSTSGRSTNGTSDWKQIKFREFQRRFGAKLSCHDECSCGGPLAESFGFCPWCGKDHAHYRGVPDFPLQCTRCGRGSKIDWRYCAWCYGPGEEPETARRYTDRRYVAHCTSCSGDLMPFMRYCPWCRVKVKRKWPIEGSRQRCRSCGWGTTREFWDYCAWCGKKEP
jgi:serine/threonine-protein kinase